MRNTHIYLAALSFTLLSSTYVTPVFADEHEPLLDKSLFSIGVGISDNSAGQFIKDETGFQFFTAYDLNQVNVMEGVKSSVEIGFMDYGFPSDNTGIWANYVVDGLISGQLGWLARLGWDFGDDSGLMIGAGVSYATSEKIELRVEYVSRDEVDSLQFNFLYQL
ncbi:hypothetical protein MnTg03_00470 [bacterium MnTg03]|nr:hypothetical protein MnTg03_00470 [bacterium MnTg03]